MYNIKLLNYRCNLILIRAKQSSEENAVRILSRYFCSLKKKLTIYLIFSTFRHLQCESVNNFMVNACSLFIFLRIKSLDRNSFILIVKNVSSPVICLSQFFSCVHVIAISVEWAKIFQMQNMTFD